MNFKRKAIFYHFLRITIIPFTWFAFLWVICKLLEVSVDNEWELREVTWKYHVYSLGIYVILSFLIFLCFVPKVLRSKIVVNIVLFSSVVFPLIIFSGILYRFYSANFWMISSEHVFHGWFAKEIILGLSWAGAIIVVVLSSIHTSRKLFRNQQEVEMIDEDG